MKTVYCFAFNDTALGGVDWYGTSEARSAALSPTGAKDFEFTVEVPDDASDEEITELVDETAEQLYFNNAQHVSAT